jgi:hypothetical protein
MSARTVDGAYVQVLSDVPRSAEANFGEIGIIGHMASGIVYDAAGSGTLKVAGTDYEVFTSTSEGVIYTFNSFAEAVNKLGIVPDSSAWSSGTYSANGDGTSPYDGEYNLIRGLELIYLGNPTAVTKVAVLTGSGSTAFTAASSSGVSLALARLIAEDGISFIGMAGADFNSVLLNHANSASGETNAAERVYVGGTSINEILASGSMVPDLSAGSGNDYDWSALLNDSGRGIFIATNVKYKFQVGHSSEPITGHEIGGNWFANYLMGFLSSTQEQQSLLAKASGFVQYYNGNIFKWTRSNQTTLNNGSVLHFRTRSGRTGYGLARTYSSSSSEYRRITTRRIIDRVIKETRATSDVYTGSSNTIENRLGMQTAVESKLSRLANFGLIKSGYSATVYVEGTDVADGVVRVAVLVIPVTEIEFIEIKLSFSLT